MLYTWTQGPHERGVIAQHLRDNRPLPKTIRDAPTLMPGLALYYGAFMDLNTCRPQGMGEGFISWLSTQEYAGWNDYSPEQTEDLHYYVRHLDSVYMTWRREQRKKGSNGK